MAIALFNILENSEYHRKVKSTEIYKFAKHIRDGAAHGNRFYLKHPLKNPVSWRDKKIISSLNQKIVFPDFISPASLLLLMSDISKIIDSQ
jgi:hypothetical protein